MERHIVPIQFHVVDTISEFMLPSGSLDALQNSSRIKVNTAGRLNTNSRK